MAAITGAEPLTIPEGLPALLRDLVLEHTGIHFDAARLDVLIDKLADLVRARGYRSYMEYYYLLKYEDPQKVEWQRVVEALSVQETYFWREYPQIRVLTERLVPQWFSSSDRPLRIWSAACATGEEPYSIAIALAEAGFGQHPIEIIGSDASEHAIEKARRGLYRERSFRALPQTLLQKYFAPEGNARRLRKEIASRVTFQRANIVEHRDVALLASAPVIFCRNVFIYFSPDTIKRTLYTLSRAMPEGGHLFVGASESLVRLTTDFHLEEIEDAFVYVRRSAARP